MKPGWYEFSTSPGFLVCQSACLCPTEPCLLVSWLPNKTGPCLPVFMSSCLSVGEHSHERE